MAKLEEFSSCPLEHIEFATITVSRVRSSEVGNLPSAVLISGNVDV